MNFKNILTIAALTGFSASVAIGQGTAPTIVQGDYVSNVFGQSNFVKNPNAKLNTKNVSVSGATVTRSVTTPLVATSEYNVAVTSANGTITWATRSFDEGMKNQNCEARFSYRGFQATSKAQIKQGANVVAELTLTPSASDPRIASINFPCGDLSAATTFVITDSATLSGTNEIGGIYVGLATNQANVAQAESVLNATQSVVQNISGVLTDIIYNTVNIDRYGSYNSSTGVYTVRKSGTYLINAAVTMAAGTITVGNYIELKTFINTTQACRSYQIAPYTGTYAIQRQIGCQIEANAGDTIKIAVQFQFSARDTIAQQGYTDLQIARLPSSSELVVTPETQNVWGGSRYYGSAFSSTIGQGVPAITGFLTFNSAGMTARRTLTGRCNAPTSSGNDIGCSIENMPVGSYKIEATGLYNLIPGTTTNDTVCSYEIYETTSATSVSNGTYKRNGQAYGIVYQPSSQSGIFQNSAVATRNFVIRGNKTFDNNASNLGGCQIFISSSGTDISSFNITVTPLDNASNSALYVQGPVKAAATGTAIPAGYVGEVIATSNYSRSFTSQVGGAWRNITEPGDVLVTPPGNYLILFQVNSGTQTNLVMACLADTGNNLDTATGPYSVSQTQQVMTGSSWPLSLSGGPEMFRVRHFRTTTTATHYIKCYWDSGSTVTTTITGKLTAIRLN